MGTSSRPKAPEAVRILLRHADAGARSAWPGSDDWRALTGLGHAQAAAAAARFRGWPIQRVLSSPSLRCRQTVVPLAQDLAVDVEPCPELTAHARLGDLLSLLADPETASAVVCTHRETLQMLFSHLAEAGVVRTEGVSPMEMAATWILYGTVGGPVPVRLEYLPAAEAVPVLRLPDVRESAASRVSGSW
jgi:phosphohistidine phosphatase SixA